MRVVFFIIAIGVLAICLANPFPLNAHDLPFTMHMITHTSLQLIVAPLLALAIPKENPFNKALIRLSAVGARHPMLTWLAGIAVMWIWHLPALYHTMPMTGMDHATTATSVLMVLHPLSLLTAGFLFCWPLVTPYKEYRLPPLTAVLYLATACVFCSLLGLLIAFAPTTIYGPVASADRQTAGLIMWVPCCFLYLAASMYILLKWFEGKKSADIITS